MALQMRAAKANPNTKPSPNYPLTPGLHLRTIVRDVRLGVREFVEAPTRQNVLQNLRSDEGQSYPTRDPLDSGPPPPSDKGSSSPSSSDSGVEDEEVQVLRPDHDMQGLLTRITAAEMSIYVNNLGQLRKFVGQWGKAQIENKILLHAQRRGILVTRGRDQHIVRNFREVVEAWSKLTVDNLDLASLFGYCLFEDFSREHEWNISMTQKFMEDHGWSFVDPGALRAPPLSDGRSVPAQSVHSNGHISPNSGPFEPPFGPVSTHNS